MKKFAKKVFAVNYAGYIMIQKSEMYSEPCLLNEKDYPFAEQFGAELVRRYNIHDDLVDALKVARLAVMAECDPGSAIEVIHKAMKLIESEQP